MDGTRGIPKPTMDNDDECNAKSPAHIRARVQKKADQRLAWAGGNRQLIVEGDLGISVGDGPEEIQYFSWALHTHLVPRTTEHPCHFVQLPWGHRLGSYEVAMSCCETKPLGTKRAAFKPIITKPPSNRVEQMERSILHLEELMRKY